MPTVVELGQPELVMTTWFGIAMPARTPAAIVERVNAEVMKVLAAPDVVAKLERMGIDGRAPNTPQDFAAFMQDDVARWKSVVQQGEHRDRLTTSDVECRPDSAGR